MVDQPDSTRGGEQQNPKRPPDQSDQDHDKRGNRSAQEPRDRQDQRGERAPDDQGNAITDQQVNENVADRAREQEEEKK